jgi:hypothetical protein
VGSRRAARALTAHIGAAGIPACAAIVRIGGGIDAGSAAADAGAALAVAAASSAEIAACVTACAAVERVCGQVRAKGTVARAAAHKAGPAGKIAGFALARAPGSGRPALDAAMALHVADHAGNRARRTAAGDGRLCGLALRGGVGAEGARASPRVGAVGFARGWVELYASRRTGFTRRRPCDGASVVISGSIERCAGEKPRQHVPTLLSSRRPARARRHSRRRVSGRSKATVS